MKKLFTILLAFTFIATAVIVIPTNKRHKANALYIDGPDGYQYGNNCIYYFSDSPITVDYSNQANMVGMQVIYDVHPYITVRELEYMLYSGYFWGFYDHSKVAVILELKTMKPPQSLLENLIACFRAQGCGVWLVTPYYSDYASLDLDGRDGVQYDEYVLFLQDTALSMFSDNGQMIDKTTLFRDGRIAGLYDIPESPDTYDILDICMNQKGFARLLNYMYNGLDFSINEEQIISRVFFDEENFEKSLYIELWDNFANRYGLSLNYFQDEEIIIDDYINVWSTIYSDENDGPVANNYYHDYEENLLMDFYEENENYYQGVINYLFNKNLHIIANVDGTTYIDLLNWLNITDVSPQTYTFTDALSFGNLYQTNLYPDGNPYAIEYVYGMGISNLKTQFYNFLRSCDLDWSIISEAYNILNDFMCFLFINEPIDESANGLSVYLNSQMREYWSNFGFNDYGDGTYDEETLFEFYQELMDFFYGNP